MTTAVVADGRTIVRQIGYEQRSFWRTPQTALFVFALPIIFMIMFNSLNKGNHLHTLGGVSAVQYFVPSMLAYGLMSVCFVNLAIQMAVRREEGLLKRVRGTPFPPGMFMASVVGNVLVISIIDVAIALLIGKLAFSLRLPSQWAPLVVAVTVGVISFSLLGLAISCFVPNAEAAPAIVNLPFLVLLVFSGAFYPFPKGSFVSHVANFFPVTHFIAALFAPFNPYRTGSAFAPHDLLVVAIWGVVGLVIALRRFTWEPRKQ